MITVPACDECNGKKSRNDDFIRDMLTTDVYGGTHPLAKQISMTKVARSAVRRSSDVAKTMFKQGRKTPFYSHGGILLGQVYSAPLNVKRINQAFFTVVRGLYYFKFKQCLPDNYDVKVLRYHPQDFRQVVKQFQEQLSPNPLPLLGEVFSGTFVIAEEDPFTSVWLLCFYNRIGISITVSNPELNLRGNENPSSEFGR